jgi:hypothetical protein
VSRIIVDAPNDALEFLVAIVVNLLFLGLVALALWPLERMQLAFSLAKGYGLLWAVVALAAMLLAMLQRFFRVDEHTSFNAYVLPGIVVCVFLLTGWSAFAALAVHNVVVGASFRHALILYVVGFLASFIGCFVVGAFYQGAVYKIIGLPVALASFVVFALWPTGGRVLYGWFFNLF